MLVPVVAWLTRSGLTAEPAAARACAAAAGGPHRAHLAALTASLAAGIVLALAGAGYELITYQPSAGGLLTRAAVTAAGLVTAVICSCVGSAIAALCNPPVIRRVGVVILTTAAGLSRAWWPGSHRRTPRSGRGKAYRTRGRPGHPVSRWPARWCCSPPRGAQGV